ncbi:endonuclease/exonuclease/phosphatase family protein [soil metagenome]
MLRFTTFNIRNGEAKDGMNSWENRRESVVRLIREIDPDIIGLQEVLQDQLFYLVAQLPNYNYVGVAREDGEQLGEYAPILFKKDRIKSLDHQTFWLSETPEVVGSGSWDTACVRICTSARLSAAGREINIFNCHLDHVSEMARSGGMSVIIQKLQSPAIVMGDFNASELETGAFGLAYAGLADTFRMAHPKDHEVGTFNNFDTSHMEGDKIDYIFATSDFRVHSSRIDRTSYEGRAVSDHFPVVADLELEIPEPF